MYKYPIKVVSQMTGLSAFVIRAWEKRYDAVTPARTETNRRLYSEDDIEKLRLLNEAVNKGHNIGGIAKLSTDELKSILNQNQITTTDPIQEELPTDIDSMLSTSIEAVKAYDGKQLETILLKASAKLSQPQLIEDFVVPLIYKIGDLWHDGDIRVAHEHLASAVIRSFLASLIEQHRPDENAPVIISATPRGQDHEIGAMIVGVIAAPLGWKVLYLGPNLPVEEISAVADSLEAKVVALSIIYPGDDQQLKKDLHNLRRILPESTSIIFGGRASTSYLDIIDEIGGTHVDDTRQLRTELNAIRKNKFN
ncbi:MAG: MerR family transcriptional regulator [Bacteroidia bacterium]|nr:MerR family transcriptional regulator [Bacteroidia bacterium]